jgi:hypothetical protein
METDSKFKAARSSRGSAARRFVPSAKANSQEKLLAKWPVLQQTLQNLPDARPDAVARAKKLIADPGYPPPEIMESLAEKLAASLLAGDDKPTI